MTAAKMIRILAYLKGNDHKLLGVWIGFSPGSEIQISLNSQPLLHVHQRLLTWGFISNEVGTYIYRPRT